MKRSPVGLLIVAALCAMALYSAGVITWRPTAWERHAAQTAVKDAGKAAKSIGVKADIPPRPTWETPTPTPRTASPAGGTAAQSVTTIVLPNGQNVPAPSVTPQIHSLYCQMENVAPGTNGCP